jgi:adenine deaminase
MVVAGLQAVEKAAVELGVKVPSPFAVLSFLALPVIPEIRLTDLGLVDVNEFKLIE